MQAGKSYAWSTCEKCPDTRNERYEKHKFRTKVATKLFTSKWQAERDSKRESERVRVRGKGDNLKSKVHKSRKYDFLFGDDEQKDNFLNQTDRERETETATATETESERERDSSKMSMTQRRTTWCWQCVCGGLEAHPACLCKIQAK